MYFTQARHRNLQGRNEQIMAICGECLLTAGLGARLYALNETVRRQCADLLTLNTASFIATKRRLYTDLKTARSAAIAADLADWQESGYGR